MPVYGNQCQQLNFNGSVPKFRCVGLVTNKDKTHVYGVKTSDGEEIGCGSLVVAGGAWARGFCKTELKEYMPLGTFLRAKIG